MSVTTTKQPLPCAPIGSSLPFISMVRINLICFFVSGQLLVALSSGAQVVRTRANSIRTGNYPIQRDSAWKVKGSLNDVTPGFTFGTYYDSRVVFWGRDFGVRQFG